MKITSIVLQLLADHAAREFPLEACGYLAQKDGLVSTHYELTNLDKRHDHFTMDHVEQFVAVRDMREKGLKLAAVYHTHPETPARPSQEDIRLAYDPDISYVIISLVNPREPDVKSFKIRKGKVTNEKIEIIESSSLNHDNN